MVISNSFRKKEDAAELFGAPSDCCRAMGFAKIEKSLMNLTASSTSIDRPVCAVALGADSCFGLSLINWDFWVCRIVFELRVKYNRNN